MFRITTGSVGWGVTGFDVGAVEAGIRETRFAGAVVHLPRVGSTNVVATEAAQAGARTGVWVADEQTAGRGRGGHGWHSVVGEGLYVSALLTPLRVLPMGRALWLSLATGMAAQGAIREVAGEAGGGAGLGVDIRWPNDLLLGGRKCGGILVETAVETAVFRLAGGVAETEGWPGASGEGEARLRYAVIGVGINLNHAGFPEELGGSATSVRMETGREVAREAMLSALLRRLDGEIAELEAEADGIAGAGRGVLERFSVASSWVRGKRVRVGEGDGYTGVTAGLDARGFLRVQGDDGRRHTVLSGGVRELT